MKNTNNDFPMTNRKIASLNELLEKLTIERTAGKKIVFTNGCFDILHAGHVRYLQAARGEGDLLVVGLNSDVSVQAIKGPARPIVSEQERAEVLAALACVDYVSVFDDPDPLALIIALRPDVLVKGEDWEEDRIVGARFVKENGGRVVRVPLVGGASTSGIIRRILERCR